VTINSNGDSVSSGNQAKWPTTMPSSIPEFKYGTISYSSSTDTADYKAWSAMFTNVSASDGAKYTAEVLAKGFVQTDTMTTNGITVTSYENGTYRLTLSLDSGSNGATVDVGLK